MNKFLHTALVFLVSLTLVNCSSDDSPPDSSSLTVNGAEFKLGTNSSTTYNTIKSKSATTLWLEIGENAADGRVISVYAMHEPDDATGTYTLRNNFIESGIAVVSLLNSEDEQIAGGSVNQPTGTISIIQMGSNRYKVTFNDVVLDPDTASETSISGICDKSFKLAPGN